MDNDQQNQDQGQADGQKVETTEHVERTTEKTEQPAGQAEG
jgi:hypothetical protein